MTRGKLLLVLALVLALTGGAAAQGKDEPAASGQRGRAAASKQAAEDRAFLNQLAEAQRALGDQLRQLRERIDWLYYEVTLRRDEHAEIQQEVKAMREEVKGLYVENSSLKQQIDALKEDVGGVNSNVSGFRTFSGFFIAVMILLLAVIFVLTIRR
jgi:chromosome segregation ATPase